MKEHKSTAIIYVYELECGHCKEWFRTESEMDEEPRLATCRHCEESMFDDDDISWTDSRFIGTIEVDLFEAKVITSDLKK